jgi:hypothetical protein
LSWLVQHAFAEFSSIQQHRVGGKNICCNHADGLGFAIVCNKLLNMPFEIKLPTHNASLVFFQADKVAVRKYVFGSSVSDHENSKR